MIVKEMPYTMKIFHYMAIVEKERNIGYMRLITRLLSFA